MRKRDLIAAAAGAVAATALAGGVAWAAIPSDGDVYTACMLKNVGTVRLIDKSLPPSNLMSHCKPALETEVSWSLQGPQGLQGLQGAKGDQGNPGQNGVDGATGPQGEKGPPGDPGQDGVSGYELVTSGNVGFPPGVASFRFVLCPQGKKALGGGVNTGGPEGVVTASFPFDSGQAWALGIRNTSASETIQTQVWAVCAAVS